MKKFKENNSTLQKFNDWLNAYEVEEEKGDYVALFRHFLLLVSFAAIMFLTAVWILKMCE